MTASAGRRCAVNHGLLRAAGKTGGPESTASRDRVRRHADPAQAITAGLSLQRTARVEPQLTPVAREWKLSSAFTQRFHGWPIEACRPAIHAPLPTGIPTPCVAAMGCTTKDSRYTKYTIIDSLWSTLFARNAIV